MVLQPFRLPPQGRHRKPKDQPPPGGRHRLVRAPAARRTWHAPVAALTGAVVLVAAGLQGLAIAADSGAGPRTARVMRSVSADQSISAPELKSKPISTSARDELIVAFLASDGPAGAAQSFRSVTGCGLRWTLVVRANREVGTSEIWKARARARMKACSVTAVRSRGAYQGVATLVAFDQAVVLNSARASGSIDNAKARITGRRGSLLYAVGNDSTAAAPRRMPPGQAIVREFLSPSNDVMWVQRATKPMPRTGTVTMGAKDPKDHRWNFAAVEIRRSRRAKTTPTQSSAAAVHAAPETSETASGQPPVAAPSSAPAPRPASTSAAPKPATSSAVVQPPAPAQPAPSSGMPTASTTGVPPGTVLTATGSLTVTTAGAVIDAKDISGDVVIEAPGVVIKRSRIRGNGQNFGIYVRTGSVTVYDSEISGFRNGIAFENWKAYRVNIHSMLQDGVKIGSNVTLEDSYIHELTPEPGAHADGGQIQDGVANVVLRHNTIDPTNGSEMGNAALMISPNLGGSGDGPVLVENNTLGGGNYTMFVRDSDDRVINNISILGNRFRRNARYGPLSITAKVTASGNVWDDTGAAISP